MPSGKYLDVKRWMQTGWQGGGGVEDASNAVQMKFLIIDESLLMAPGF
jgi:hypothetical protein